MALLVADVQPQAHVRNGLCFRSQRDFAGTATDIGLEPSFLSCFDRGYRFAKAA